MSTFEFVTVLMSIVVGLGVTRILSGLADLVEHRASIALDWVTLIWAVNVLLYDLVYWWVVVNHWRFLTTWSIARFAPLFLYGVLLYFCAALILPSHMAEGLELKARFESIRRPFFLLWLLVLCSDLLDSLMKGTEYVLTELGAPYLAIVALSAVGGVAGMRISDRRFHIALAVVFLVTVTVWSIARFGVL